MKRPTQIALFLLFATFGVFQHESFAIEEHTFHIYAPSRTSQSLLIVSAYSTSEGLSLTLERKVELGFAPATIVANSEKRLLYISGLRSEQENVRGAVVTLDERGRYDSHKELKLKRGYAFLSLDRSARFLLGADYFGGVVDVYEIDETGHPGKQVQSLNAERRFAHCVLPSPDNKFVYIPYVKENNALYQYRFDAETGKLTALDPLNANPPEGTGPRHMAYHPKLPVVYFSNEQHLGVSVYTKQESGQLKLKQVCAAVDKDEPTDGVSSSDILITPDGKFIFAGIRGHKRDFDRISRYRVKPDGELELLGLTEADEIPWGLTLSPNGKYLLVTAFRGGTLTAFKIEQDGNLTKAATLEWDQQISDVVSLTP